MNALCEGIFGHDASSIALGMMRESIDAGVLRALPVSTETAVAMLLGDLTGEDDNAKRVASAIVNVVRSRL